LLILLTYISHFATEAVADCVHCNHTVVMSGEFVIMRRSYFDFRDGFWYKYLVSSTLHILAVHTA
jgi:hypothetical protein